MKDLSQFLSEKKKDITKPHAVEEGEGADDKKFLALMSEYKQTRRSDSKAANKLLDQAEKLGKSGDVSAKARVAAAYL